MNVECRLNKLERLIENDPLMKRIETSVNELYGSWQGLAEAAAKVSVIDELDEGPEMTAARIIKIMWWAGRRHHRPVSHWPQEFRFLTAEGGSQSAGNESDCTL